MIYIGEHGISGEGGKGGKESRYGDIIEATYTSVVVGFMKVEVTSKPGKTIPSGRRGLDAQVCKNYNGSNKTDWFFNPSYTINSYKNYLTEHLTNNIRETELKEFLNNIGDGERI